MVKAPTYSIIINGSNAGVFRLSGTSACRLPLAWVVARGVGNGIRHEAGLVFALPVSTVVAPLFQSVSNCRLLDDGKSAVRRHRGYGCCG